MLHRYGNTTNNAIAIGADGTVKPVEESGKESDLFATFGGNSVTLQSRHGSRMVSDFLTEEDAKELREERLEKERRRQAKMLEKMRKKDGKRRKTKKDKKKRRRKDDESDDEEGEGGGLLASLEATAVGNNGARRGCRDGPRADEARKSSDGAAAEEDEMAKRRCKFEEVVAKGKERTDRAFRKPLRATVLAIKVEEQDTDEEEEGGG